MNKKVLNKFKDETAGIPPIEFVGLRSKMYSLLVSENEPAKMRAKGIKKSFLKRHMRHEQYLNTLRTRQITHAKFLNFQSKRHRIYTVEFNKVCLSAYDDKRFVLKDGVGTLPHGHFKLRDPVVRATL